MIKDGQNISSVRKFGRTHNVVIANGALFKDLYHLRTSLHFNVMAYQASRKLSRFAISFRIIGAETSQKA